MSGALGPIVIDPHAFRRLVPALAVWLLLFATAGDGRNLLARQWALRAGERVEGRVEAKRIASVHLLFGRERRHLVEFSYRLRGAAARGAGAVSRAGAGRVREGSPVELRLHRGRAYLADDLGYSRWKLGLFGAAFVALWAWAAATYRFG